MDTNVFSDSKYIGIHVSRQKCQTLFLFLCGYVIFRKEKQSMASIIRTYYTKKTDDPENYTSISVATTLVFLNFILLHEGYKFVDTTIRYIAIVSKIFYVPPARKLVFSLQLTVAQCSILRYRGMKCKN